MVRDERGGTPPLDYDWYRNAKKNVRHAVPLIDRGYGRVPAPYAYCGVMRELLGVYPDWIGNPCQTCLAIVAAQRLTR